MATPGESSMKNADDYRLVAAIDFGTTYSGYAVCYRHEPVDITINKNWGPLLGHSSYEKPTWEPRDPNGKFSSVYETFTEIDTAGYDLHLYKQFKMMIQEQFKMMIQEQFKMMIQEQFKMMIQEQFKMMIQELLIKKETKLSNKCLPKLSNKCLPKLTNMEALAENKIKLRAKEVIKRLMWTPLAIEILAALSFLRQMRPEPQILRYDQEMVVGTSRRRAYVSSNAQKDKDLAKAHPSTPQKDGFKKIRLNLPAIEDEGISNLGDLLNQLYNKKVFDKNDMMLIQQANGRSNKTRELLFILFIKDPMAWVFDILLHIKNSPDTIFLYQMIANTYTGLDSCHPADMWKIVMQADNRNHKAVVLKEMIRQNLMYLSRVLTKKPLPEIDMSVFADAELEYITSQPDKKQEVKASLICLLGRENVGWVFEFIRMLLNDERNQLLVDVFGTTDVTEI